MEPNTDIISESKASASDIMEIYEIKDGKWVKLCETNNNPTFFQKALSKIGLYCYADDALTNYALSDIAGYFTEKYTHISLGTSAATPDDYTLTDLVTPLPARFPVSATLATTHTTDDTAVFTSIIVSPGDYVIKESGLHDALTGGNMGARQVCCDWTIQSTKTYGLIWKIVCGRG